MQVSHVQVDIESAEPLSYVQIKQAGAEQARKEFGDADEMRVEHIEIIDGVGA